MVGNGFPSSTTKASWDPNIVSVTFYRSTIGQGSTVATCDWLTQGFFILGTAIISNRCKEEGSNEVRSKEAPMLEAKSNIHQELK
jgi:hypothetical protein